MIRGVGVDLIEVGRIQKAIERWGDDFLNHVYNPEEIEASHKFNKPYQHFAGRFAAKEAIFKACSIPSLTWKQITIINDATGKPVCNLSVKHSYKVHISISHIKDYALAQAIAEE